MATRSRNKVTLEEGISDVVQCQTKTRLMTYPQNWSDYNDWTYFKSGSLEGAPSPANHRIWMQSSMTDDDAKLTGKDRTLAFKPVLHTKQSLVSKGFTFIPYEVNTDREIWGWCRCLDKQWVSYLPLEYIARQYALSAYQYRRYAIHRCLPTDAALLSAREDMEPKSGDVTRNLGILVFLAELRDFKNLARALRYPLESLAKTSERVLKCKNIGDVLKLGTALGAEQRLTLKFAFEPLIGDLKTIYNGIFHLDSWLKKWNADARACKVHARHTDITHYLSPVRPLVEGARKDTWRMFVGQRIEPTVRLDFRQYYTIKGTAHLWYKPLVIDMTPMRKLMHLLDAMGLGHTGSNLWNVIPFSFLVDYVVSTDRFFAQFDKNCADMPTETLGMGWSVKQTVTSECTASTSSGSSCTAKLLDVVYERNRVHPVPEIGTRIRLAANRLHSELPSHGQVLNAVALLGTRLR